MNLGRFFSRSLIGSCLIFSASSFATDATEEEVLEDVVVEETAQNIFGGSGGMSITPVLEYEFSNEGEFSTGGGNMGTFELENGLSFGVDVTIPIDVPNLRLEGNFRYRTGGLDSVVYSAAYDENENKLTKEQLAAANKAVKFSGDVNKMSFGASAYYDFDSQSFGNGSMTPYVGGGIHFNSVSLDNVTVSAGDMSANYDDKATGFGFSLGGGVNVAVSDNVDARIGYVYRREMEMDFEGTSNGKTTTLTVDEMASHAIMAGITIRF